MPAVPYLATYILSGGELEQTLLFVCPGAGGDRLMPLWSMTSRRVGKQRGFIHGVHHLPRGRCRPVLRAQPAGRRCLRWSAWWAYAGMRMFLLAMFLDSVARGRQWCTASQRAGVFTGVWAAGETVALASTRPWWG